MIVTQSSNRDNRNSSLLVAGFVALSGLGLGSLAPPWFVLVPIAFGLYWWLRSETVRRQHIQKQPFPATWESILKTKVNYYRALDDTKQDKFRKLVQTFLDEVTITGIKTEVDEPTRVLVAASAVIPILGLDDFEYSGLGEVLIYPASFNENYGSSGEGDANILGMVGTHHLSGVMILSKPSLFAGFENATDKRNVGIHEFAHLVDKADGSVDGSPPTMTDDASHHWVHWVGEELRREVNKNEHIDDYAYTNEAEYFAVLSEYFFEAPKILEQKNPQLYSMMQKMYHQNPKRLNLKRFQRKRRIGRNDPCPCGSQEKYKRCCRRKSQRGLPS